MSEFTRDRLHRETRRSQGARWQTREYDSLGRRTRQQSAVTDGVALPEQDILSRAFRYSARGELAGIHDTLRGQVDYGYDAEGRLLKHYEARQGHASRQTYVYDPAESWSPLARIDHQRDAEQGEMYWFSTDLNGAPLEVTDAGGTVRWSGQYGSFGEVSRQTEGFYRLPGSESLHHQPLRYAGQYADRETGLHYNLFRYYDPQVGRFTVQDPIGVEGGLNLYAYVKSPFTRIDPLGLVGCDPKARQHILHGDGPGSGGHMWPGQPGKTVFPQNWDTNKILREVDDIFTSPSTKWYAQQGTGGALTKLGKPANWVAWEIRDGVQIRIIYQPATGRVITAFPDSGPIPSLPGAR